MFEDEPGYEAFFVPFSVGTDDAVDLGVTWLRQQSGTGLIALHAKKMLTNNRRLAAAVSRYRWDVVSPPRLWQSSWSGGAVLAPWASERVLTGIDEDLAIKATAVCVLSGSADADRIWRSARQAIDLTGQSLVAIAGGGLDPVVVAAMTDVCTTVNHNNALVQTEDKAYAVLTLQLLVRSGIRFDVDELCAWALGNGFTAAEVKHLRQYAQQVLQGRSFRLGSAYGPTSRSLERWRAQAAGRP